MKENRKNIRNVPNLRFRGFEGEWEEKHLGELVENIKARISTSFLSADNYISTENILQNFQGVAPASSIPCNTNVIAFKKCDVLFSNIRPYLKKIWFANYDGGCSTDVFVFRSSNMCAAKFLYHSIANDKFINYVMLATKGTKMPRGDKQQIHQYSVYLPSKLEQDKIVALLSLLDDRISTQSQIIEELKSLIKGLNKKLFSQQIRFKDNRGNDFPNWEIKDFDEVLMSVPTKKYQIKSSDYYTVGKYKVIDQGQELIAGYSDDEENVFYDFPVIVFGDHTTIIKYIDFPFVVGADGTKLLRNKKQENLKYLYYNLIYNNIKQDGYKRHFTILSEIYIHIPSVEEQNKIANFLSSIDQKLEAEKQILKKYTEQKKYLLANMFI